MALLPSPTCSDTNGAGAHGDGGHLSAEGHQTTLPGVARDIALLPTPAVNDMGAASRATDGAKGGQNQRGSSGDLMLPSAVNLLPTPTAQDSASSGAAGYTTGHAGTTLTDATVRQPDRWGEYGPAIRRWEALTRPAPEPTKPNSKGNPKLSDEFDEWLMGWPASWVSNVPSVTWNEALKACGNGVVIQQAAAAVTHLLRRIATAA